MDVPACVDRSSKKKRAERREEQHQANNTESDFGFAYSLRCCIKGVNGNRNAEDQDDVQNLQPGRIEGQAFIQVGNICGRPRYDANGRKFQVVFADDAGIRH